MRASGRLAARVLEYAGSLVRPGLTTDEIDKAVHAMIVEAGAYPSPLNYGGCARGRGAGAWVGAVCGRGEGARAGAGCSRGSSRARGQDGGWFVNVDQERHQVSRSTDGGSRLVRRQAACCGGKRAGGIFIPDTCEWRVHGVT